MKRLKRLLRRRMKNSGFTLVELVISCGLLGILIVGVTAFIGPVLKSAANDEKNVRATLLAQTMDEFVNRSIRDSYFAIIFTNAKDSDAAKDGTIAEHEKIKAMKKYVDDHSDICELKCFSYRWQEDVHGQEWKYMLMTEKFSKEAPTALDFSKSIPVYENCLYDGLFPQIEIEQLKTKSADESDPNADEDGKVYVPAIKTTYTVNTDQNMKITGFIGVGYTDFINIRADEKREFYGVNPLESDEEHPAIFIYYVARKPSIFDVTTSSST